jgi:hypothetical protein
MKNSESANVPLSCRPGSNNALTKAHASSANLDCTVSKSRYGICMKKGNFRRTQEDRVSIPQN